MTGPASGRYFSRGRRGGGNVGIAHRFPRSFACELECQYLSWCRTGGENRTDGLTAISLITGLTPSVLLWFVHLLCQGCDRPVGIAPERVAGSAIDADLSIGDRDAEDCKDAIGNPENKP